MKDGFKSGGTMRYVAYDRPGGPEVLTLAEGPIPSIEPGEVLIRVAAAGVNRPDIVQRQGNYPPPAGASTILGLEVAGTIVDVAPDVGSPAVSDQVCALLAGGGYAEHCAVPAVQCLPIPKGLSAVEAAAIPETFFTVWTNVFDRGRLKAGETALIHGGSSGIGTVAIQLCRAFGATVFATAGSDAKCDACRSLGAAAAFNYRTEEFVAGVRELTGGNGVDLILDMVGGSYFERNIEALAIDGRLVQIAVLQGSRVEMDLHRIMVKRLTITGSTLRPRSPQEKGQIAEGLRHNVWPLLESGKVKPVIDKTFPLTDAAQAHRYLEAGGHIGKVVLVVGDGPDSKLF